MGYALLKAETKKILAFLAKHPPPPTPASARDVAGVLLGLHGLRIQEVCNLRVDDFDQQQRTIRVATLKGGPAGTLPLLPAAVEAIRIHLAHRGRPPPGAPLLSTRNGTRVDQRNLRRRWHAWAGKSIDRRPRFHDLRHTTAAHAWEASGKDQRAVQRLLRHQKLATTEIYLPDAQLSLDLIPGAQPSTRSKTKTAHHSSRSRRRRSRKQQGASSTKSRSSPSRGTPQPRASGSKRSRRRHTS